MLNCHFFIMIIAFKMVHLVVYIICIHDIIIYPSICVHDALISNCILTIYSIKALVYLPQLLFK